MASIKPIEFTATEAGFSDGLGGASNAAGENPYHYILFGQQTFPEHPQLTGLYFEFDSQTGGSVNGVTRVIIADGAVEFHLKRRRKITVRCGTKKTAWQKFLKGIRAVFPAGLVH